MHKLIQKLLRCYKRLVTPIPYSILYRMRFARQGAFKSEKILGNLDNVQKFVDFYIENRELIDHWEAIAKFEGKTDFVKFLQECVSDMGKEKVKFEMEQRQGKTAIETIRDKWKGLT